MELYSRKMRRAQAAFVRQRYTDELREIPFSECPANTDPNRIKVFASRKYLVQIFKEDYGFRLSINRTTISSSGWKENLTWDELQDIKNAVGFSDAWAVEYYPPKDKVVNVANIRHLWIYPETPKSGWNRGDNHA